MLLCMKYMNSKILTFSISVLSTKRERILPIKLCACFTFPRVPGLLFIQIISVQLFLKLL